MPDCPANGTAEHVYRRVFRVFRNRAEHVPQLFRLFRLVGGAVKGLRVSSLGPPGDPSFIANTAFASRAQCARPAHDLDLSGRVDYDGVVRFATPSAGGSELDVSAVTVSRDARRSSGFRQDLTPRTPSAADDPFPFAPSGDPFNMEQSK